MRAAQIDEVARDVVRRAGYSSWPDGMRTVWAGHPIGGFSSLVINAESQDVIKEDMVFAIESLIRPDEGFR